MPKNNEYRPIKEYQIKEDISHLIKAVVLGTIPKFNSYVLYPSLVIDVIEDLYDDVEIGDIDINGWDWDYWRTVFINGESYTISGTGYYGGLVFSKDIEEDDE